MPANPADLVNRAPGERVAPMGVRGKVARDVADAADPIYVLVPDGDTGRVVEEGPMYWPPPPPGALPAKGDPALVIVDDYGDPWVACWWGAR